MYVRSEGKTMRRLSVSIPAILLTLLLAACVGEPTVTPTVQPTATTLPFIALIATATATPLPEQTTAVPTPAPTVATYQITRATINIEALYLREGPGFLFDQYDVYPKGQKVDVIAQEPDGDWFFVQTADLNSGWMNKNYLDLEGSISNIPATMPLGVLVIKGHVYMPNHVPANKISVTIMPAGTNDTTRQDVANTNDRGEWYIFLPASFEGSWTIGPNGYSPESNATNGTGSLAGSFPEPQTITVPVSADTWIDFYMTP